jgi:ribosomal protein S18 acetylase RimI-like enzyme
MSSSAPEVRIRTPDEADAASIAAMCIAIARDLRARRVGLGVDGQNTTGAVRLYERAGMRPSRRIDTYEKSL